MVFLFSLQLFLNKLSKLFYHSNLDKRKTNGASKAPHNQSRLALSICLYMLSHRYHGFNETFFLFFPFIELSTHPFETGKRIHLSKLKDLFEALRLSHDMFYEN